MYFSLRGPEYKIGEDGDEDLDEMCREMQEQRASRARAGPAAAWTR